MNDHLAILFQNVSKRYQIRHKGTDYLKDRLTNKLRRLNPFYRGHQNQTTEEFMALNNVSFEIKRGESVGIIGPNGSGKSTMLKILSGVTRQTTGQVKVNGKLGALIEVGAGFHPELTGRENVFLNGSILGMKRSDIKRKFDEIVGFAEIDRFIDTPVKFYSSGMYVRLGFSIAINIDPEILLIDEVLAVGDLAFQKKCFSKMEELKESGRTFVLVSHSMSHIQSLCRRAIFLQNGQLIADGDPVGVSNIYIDNTSTVSDKKIVKQESEHIQIQEIRLLDEDGRKTNHRGLNRQFLFEIEYAAREEIVDPTVLLILKRDGQRIYSINSRIQNIHFGALKGRGVIRCHLPELSLMPNLFDVEVVMFDAHQIQILAHIKHQKMFSISPPDQLEMLGCELNLETAERGIIYGPASWEACTDETVMEKTLHT
jgi:ABC-type polysaccharide/polyol phosphate transport system ATPase subunit